MKISYDSEADAIYIELIEGVSQVRTIRLSEDVALDMGKSEELVGIEILSAKENIGNGQIPPVILHNLKYQNA
ncbi:MAG: DUF2283 domain-containing protein [FCB group bacterium]